MPTVILVKADATGTKLEFEVNGNESNGRASAERDEDVLWIVQGGTDLEYIDRIEWKQISGSENIFPAGEPKQRQSGANPKRHWQGKVIHTVEPLAVYVYTIWWKKKDVSDPIEFDPVISIKPSAGFTSFLSPILGALVGGVASFFYFYMKRLKENRIGDNIKR